MECARRDRLGSVLKTFANIGVFWKWILFCMMLVNRSLAKAKGLPSTPSHLRVDTILPTRATVYWDYNVTDHNVTRFELSYHPLLPVDMPLKYNIRIVAELEPNKRTYELKKLLENTTYELFIAALSSAGMSNRSDTVTFVTTSNAELINKASKELFPSEAIIILLILLAWCISIVLFVSRWNSLRVLPPRTARYKQEPKNLGNVKVIKRAQESVIYKSYSRQMSFTMIEREKRLERMQTKQTLQTIAMEDETTKM